MKNTKKIIISHIHVWDKNNKGDQAIVLAVQEQLRSFFPGLKIIDFPVESLKSYDAQVARQINASDGVVIGGGGIFYSYFLPFSKKMIRAIKVPLIIYGAGYIREIGARPLSQESIESLVYLIKKARLVGVRENYTKKFLVRYGALASKIEVVGDPAALLKEERPSKEIIKKLGLDKKSLKIGLNLNYSGWLGFGKWQADILGAYQGVARDFSQKYQGGGDQKLSFYYLQHHPGENNIYPALKIKGLKIINLPPAQQKYAYSRLDLVIGMMLHAGVMAFGAGTPEISVAYDLRNYSFARFISCPELVVDLENLSQGALLKKSREVFVKREIYRQIFSQKLGKIKNSSDKFLSKIKECL